MSTWIYRKTHAQIFAYPCAGKAASFGLGTRHESCHRWIVDRAALTVTPVYTNGIFGPALELRELFQQFIDGPSDGT